MRRQMQHARRLHGLQFRFARIRAHIQQDGIITEHEFDGSGNSQTLGDLATAIGALYPASTVTVMVVSNPTISAAAPVGFQLAGVAVQVQLVGAASLIGSADITMTYPPAAAGVNPFTFCR